MKALTLVAALFGGALSAQPITVVLVRHAERAAAPANDPPLTTAGMARAKELARVLRDVRPAAIYVSQFLRTQQTAQPFAAASGVSPTRVVSTTDLVANIRSQPAGSTVVVVGHSDTVPDIIQRLQGPTITMASTEFDRLFVLTLTPGVTSRLWRNNLTALRYGAP